MNRISAIFLTSFLALALACACSSRIDLDARLDSIESYINGSPGKALDSLRAMAREELSGKRVRARHALLHSMALDKCYIDVTSDSIIAPAVRHFRHNGTADQRLKTLYYLGRIYFYRGEKESAMEQFMKAEEFVPKAEDNVAKGLLYMGKAEIFSELYDYAALIENARTAGDFYMAAKDTAKHVGTLCNIANCYLMTQQYDSCRSALEQIRRMWDNASPTKKSSYYHTLIYMRQETESPEAALQSVQEYIKEVPPEYVQWPTVAEIYNSAGDPGSALETLTDNTGFIPDYENNAAYYTTLSDALYALGRYKEAYDAEYRFTELSDGKGFELIDDHTHATIEKLKAQVQLSQRNLFILLLILGIVIIILLYTQIVDRMRKRLRQKNKEKERLAAEKTAAEKEKARLETENRKIEQERKHFQTLYASIRREKETLEKTVSNSNITEDTRQHIFKRLAVLDNFITAHISGNRKEIALKELEGLISDREQFLYSTRLSFALMHPDFISFLKGKDLSEKEMGYCCLYLMGFTGKDIGNYLKVKEQYNVNSSIRQKLGLGEHDQHLTGYLFKKIQEIG